MFALLPILIVKLFPNRLSRITLFWLLILFSIPLRQFIRQFSLLNIFHLPPTLLFSPRSPRNHRNTNFNNLLNIPQILHLLHAAERNGLPLLPSPRRPSDPVHVRLRNVGKLVIVHLLHVGNIQPPGGHVGGHQHTDLPRFERGEGLIPRRLGFVPVDGHRLDTRGDQFLGEFFHAVLGPPEHDGTIDIVSMRELVGRLQQLKEFGGFVRFGDVMQFLGDFIGRLTRP
mmetsp:Transcript_164/g.147  ORF Transcript_164/g.147 Transcript_164/m.147 type:complete len:228 (-) Transcript_164:615-1298(-)